MTIRIENKDNMYGFGATADRHERGPSVSSKRVLSFVALALTSAVVALIITLSPAGTASANTIIVNSSQNPDGLGLAATLSFALSTALGAALIFGPGLIRQRMRRHQRR